MNPKLPVDMKIARGTLRPSREKARGFEFSPAAEIPTAPDWITGRALVEWLRIVGMLEDQHILSAFDQTALAQYCVLSGALGDDPAGFTAAQHVQLRMVSQELGFTPLSRTKVRPIQSAESDTENPWALGYGARRP